MRELVIELPTPHALVLAELHRQRRHDLLHVLAINGRAPVAVLPPAVIHAAAVRVHHQDLGCLRVSHTGGVALGVQRMTLSPFFAASSTFCSSHSKRKRPSSGSMKAHANSPI